MQTFDIKDKRILEVGCGVGLSSIMLNSRHADITATDHHPEAQEYLKVNVLLNDGDPIAFERTGWEDENTTLGEFDLIIGSDLLYQPNHPELLSGFISRHAKADCEVIVVDPGRGNLARFEKAMLLEGFVVSVLDIQSYVPDDETFSGRLRSYKRTHQKNPST